MHRRQVRGNAVGILAISATGNGIDNQPRPLPIPLKTMSNKIDAAAKDAEGKIQSAVGSLTGDKGQQIKGEAKQVQADAMKAEAKVREEANKAAKKVEDATE
ncbi:CsbD family protein [Cyanobium gracile UHCC 0139]|uniref:CsbD family protein n=1 Tax=Cyanobium gracile UHCC 0139 TaxID=3110308 RepID=A0ABU5RSU4_9CYAN|nr:CsbD family protein [Cyanobium gracile]MEA5390815.1 CsbD family protein [Cyanobium gracile UHCC 0139]